MDARRDDVVGGNDLPASSILARLHLLERASFAPLLRAPGMRGANVWDGVEALEAFVTSHALSIDTAAAADADSAEKAMQLLLHRRVRVPLPEEAKEKDSEETDGPSKELRGAGATADTSSTRIERHVDDKKDAVRAKESQRTERSPSPDRSGSRSSRGGSSRKGRSDPRERRKGKQSRSRSRNAGGKGRKSGKGGSKRKKGDKGGSSGSNLWSSDSGDDRWRTPAGVVAREARGSGPRRKAGRKSKRKGKRRSRKGRGSKKGRSARTGSSSTSSTSSSLSSTSSSGTRDRRGKKKGVRWSKNLHSSGRSSQSETAATNSRSRRSGGSYSTTYESSRDRDGRRRRDARRSSSRRRRDGGLPSWSTRRDSDGASEDSSGSRDGPYANGGAGPGFTFAMEKSGLSEALDAAAPGAAEEIREVLVRGDMTRSRRAMILAARARALLSAAAMRDAEEALLREARGHAEAVLEERRGARWRAKQRRGTRLGFSKRAPSSASRAHGAGRNHHPRGRSASGADASDEEDEHATTHAADKRLAALVRLVPRLREIESREMAEAARSGNARVAANPGAGTGATMRRGRPGSAPGAPAHGAGRDLYAPVSLLRHTVRHGIDDPPGGDREGGAAREGESARQRRELTLREILDVAGTWTDKAVPSVHTLREMADPRVAPTGRRWAHLPGNLSIMQRPRRSRPSTAPASRRQERPRAAGRGAAAVETESTAASTKGWVTSVDGPHDDDGDRDYRHL